ncbi:MAG: hypothetical protein NZ898_09110 [Myxococcota bacterium]|nr:hypothetical protein [Myxococcota bacterium]MDW8364092.1 hypothetical protein [Myxococcales bacterium]
MTERLGALLLCIALLAGWLVVHFSLLLAVLRATRFAWLVRLAALLLPALTPLVAWQTGRRTGPKVWLLLGAGYVLCRLWLGG